MMPEVDRSSPDGQERDIVPPCQPDHGGKGGEEVERLQERITLMEDERKGLEAKVAQLEESLELMQGEFESMEDYWQRKLEEERVFYEEQLRSSERQFSELESRMREYEELVVDNRNNMGKNQEEVEPESLSEEDKLSTIEEMGSLEVQVTEWEEEIACLRQQLEDQERSMEARMKMCKLQNGRRKSPASGNNSRTRSDRCR